MEEERKIVSQSVQASEKQNAARKDHCSVCRGDELHIHSSPGALTLHIMMSHCQYMQQYFCLTLAYDWDVKIGFF